MARDIFPGNQSVCEQKQAQFKEPTSFLQLTPDLWLSNSLKKPEECFWRDFKRQLLLRKAWPIARFHYKAATFLSKHKYRCLRKSCLTFSSVSPNPFALHVVRENCSTFCQRARLALSLRASLTPVALFVWVCVWLALAGAVTWTEMRKGHTGLWQDTAHNERL